MDLGLQNKVIVVAGRGTAIENEIALVLSEEGTQVVVTGNTGDDAHGFKQALQGGGNNIYSVRTDLMLSDSCSGVIDLINNKFGRIDGLVNCAGESDILDSLAGDYLMTHYSLPYLKSAKGTILNLCYGTRDRGKDITADYAAVNGGRKALTREWAVELLYDGIRVNAIIMEDSHLKKPAARCEIANAVAFFISARASHVTGQLIHLYEPH